MRHSPRKGGAELPLLPVPLGARQYIPTPPHTTRPQACRSIDPLSGGAASVRTVRRPRREREVTIGLGTQGLRECSVPDLRKFDRVELDTSSSKLMAAHSRWGTRCDRETHRKWMATHPACRPPAPSPKDRVGSPRMRDEYQDKKQRTEAAKERREDSIGRRNDRFAAMRKEHKDIISQSRQEDAIDRRCRAETVKQQRVDKMVPVWQWKGSCGGWHDLTESEGSALETARVLGTAHVQLPSCTASVGRGSAVCDVSGVASGRFAALETSDGMVLAVRRHSRVPCSQNGAPAADVRRSLAAERLLAASARRRVAEEAEEEQLLSKEWAKSVLEHERRVHTKRRKQLDGSVSPRREEPPWRSRLNRELKQVREQVAAERRTDASESRQRGRQRREEVTERRQKLAEQRKKAILDDLQRDRSRRHGIENERLDACKRAAAQMTLPRSRCSSPTGLQLSVAQGLVRAERVDAADAERVRHVLRSQDRYQEKEEAYSRAKEMRDAARERAKDMRLRKEDATCRSPSPSKAQSVSPRS